VNVPPHKPTPEQIARIRRAAEAGLPKRDVLRIEKLTAPQLEHLIKGHGIRFPKVSVRVKIADAGNRDREAALERAKATLKRETIAARLEIEAAIERPFKGRPEDWG
jgi:hypothetical protein